MSKAMLPLVKICGLSTLETVDAAIRLGATHIGLVHYEPSPRHIDLKTAAELRHRAGLGVDHAHHDMIRVGRVDRDTGSVWKGE